MLLSAILPMCTVILEGGRIGLCTANQLGCVQWPFMEPSSQRAFDGEATQRLAPGWVHLEAQEQQH